MTASDSGPASNKIKPKSNWESLNHSDSLFLRLLTQTEKPLRAQLIRTRVALCCCPTLVARVGGPLSQERRLGLTGRGRDLRVPLGLPAASMRSLSHHQSSGCSKGTGAGAPPRSCSFICLPFRLGSMAQRGAARLGSAGQLSRIWVSFRFGRRTELSASRPCRWNCSVLASVSPSLVTGIKKATIKKQSSITKKRFFKNQELPSA